MARSVLALWLLPLSLASAQQPLLKAPAGFQVELVLQAPDIEAPTALAVAPNGDVYYAEDPMDMRGPTTKNIDKIWMLQGGDPKKKTLVAENLWAVMGLEIVRDQLFVVHPPFVSFFRLDGEGKPIGRTDLFTDLGPKVAGLPGFNDHVCSGIRMGTDGWLYVSIGDKGIPAMTRKEKDLGSVHVAEGRWRHTKEGNVISLEGGGVIRFRPDGSGLEVFASGTRNHLDVPLDDHDRIFVRDNTNDGGGWNTRLMYLPRGGFLGYPWAFTRHPSECVPLVHDFGGGSPCGGWVYLDDGLPETYRGRVIHCEWGKGKVFAVKLTPKGGSFDFADEVTLLDPTGTGVKDFRPFTIRPTADGRGFYVTDWAFSGWVNKTVAGRLWKVTYTGTDVKPAARIDTTAANLVGLAKALSHPAHSQRIAAQRELIARAAKQPREVSQALTDTLGDNQLPYRHAVWVDAALPEGTGLAGRMATSQDNDVRIEAIRVLAEREKIGTQEVTKLLVDRLLIDAFPPTRIQILAALRGRTLAANQGQNLYFMLQAEMDPTVRHMAARLFREEQPRELLLQTVKTTGGPERQSEPMAKTLCWLLGETFDPVALPTLIGLLKHAEPTVRSYAVETLHRNYQDRKLYAGTWWGTRPEQQKPPARTVAWEGTPTVREAIVTALADADAGVRQTAVRALVEMRDPATFEPLRTRLATEKAEPARVDLVRAIAGLRTVEGAALLRAMVSDETNPVAVRVEAIAGLDATKADELLRPILEGNQPAPVQVAALAALTRLKSPALAESARRGLMSKEASVRKTAAQAIATTGDAAQGKHVWPLLMDRDPEVQVVAIRTLGELQDRGSIGLLLMSTATEATRFDALLALTRMPEKRCLPAYLQGLASKNVELRQRSAQALGTIRDEAAPLLQILVDRGEVPATVLPELRAVYTSFEPIATWSIIGPFPDNGKVHPPQREIDQEKKYEGAGKEVAWRKDRKGDPKNHGKVNLASLFSPSDGVVVYAHAEIDSATDRASTLLLGSDDTMRVWVNGTKVFEFTGSRGWKHDSNRIDIKLMKGKNALLVEVGNKSGPWEFSVGISADVSKYAFLQGGGGKLTIEAYRDFARKNASDAERGRKLFLDVKGVACIKCHTVGGVGGKVGPAIDDVALKYKREDLMASILEPSRTIANGYESIAITTLAGKVIAGVFKGETAETVNVMDDEGKPHEIAKKDIDERSLSPVSRMPNGLKDGMTLQDFADLVAFLETCRQEKPGGK